MSAVRQSRATLDRGRANSHQGQQPGDAGDISGIGPPPGWEPTPTRLQQLRQQISDARRAQINGGTSTKIDEIQVVARHGKYAAICPFCRIRLVKDSRANARSKMVDHIAREHR